MIRDVFLQPIATCLLALAVSAAASASTIFYDDFNDRNAADGTPVGWLPVPGFPGTFDASSGDYFLAPSDRAIVTTVPALKLRDASIRTQVRILEPSAPGGGVEILARGDRSTVSAYLAGINEQGAAYITSTDVSCCFVRIDTGLRPLEHDVIMQLDVFGTSLKMWAWPAGEPMPSAPLLTATNNRHVQGEVGIDYFSLQPSPMLGNAIFRYVHVASSHIPEPSTLLIVIVGGMTATICPRHRRRC
jgi:hypothetical protein